MKEKSKIIKLFLVGILLPGIITATLTASFLHGKGSEDQRKNDVMISDEQEEKKSPNKDKNSPLESKKQYEKMTIIDEQKQLLEFERNRRGKHRLRKRDIHPFKKRAYKKQTGCLVFPG